MSGKKERDPLLMEAINDAKKDKYRNILNKYQRVIIAAISCIILSAVVCVFYHSYKKNQEYKYSAILHQALVDANSENTKEAKNSLKVIHQDKSAPSNIRALASLKYAGILIEENRFEEGIEIFLKINNTSQYDQYVRDLSGLLALKSLIDTNNNKFEKRIIDLASELEESSEILKYFVIEQKAIFEWNRGGFKLANGIFKSLIENPEVSKAVKDRSSEMNRIYISKFGKEVKSDQEEVKLDK